MLFKPTTVTKLMRQAWRHVHLAVRAGVLVKPTRCEFCKLERPLQAHHDDYTRPLDVAWLCSPCHRVVHALLDGLEVRWCVGEPRARVIGQYAAARQTPVRNIA